MCETEHRPRPQIIALAVFALITFFCSINSVVAHAEMNGGYSDDGVDLSAVEALDELFPPDASHSKAPKQANNSNSKARDSAPAPYTYVWVPTSAFTGCPMDPTGGAWSCGVNPNSCEAGSGATLRGNGINMTPGTSGTTGTTADGITQRGTRISTEDGSREDLGIRCTSTNLPAAGDVPAAGDAPTPVVITVSLSDFADMPITPLVAHAGPTDGWLPVNMPNILYTDTKAQELEVELLDTPVAIRATPISYEWDLGDGNAITTDNPGKPYPSEVVSSTYSTEGWYDITLTTTFTGQFAVNGGPWQDIVGSIEVASEPVPIYSKSLESRLVDGNVPVDDGVDPWIPERTADTEGAQDPDATHRAI